MKRDSKLFAALHILTHLAVTPERPLTSDELAGCLQTHPVVIRRALAGLREAGIVTSTKGHGGGWSLARPAAAITLGEVYDALGDRDILSPAPEPEAPGCLIEAMVNGALDSFYAEAETLLRRRLNSISIADITTELHRKAGTWTGLPHTIGAATGTDTGQRRPSHGHATERTT